MKRFLFDDDGAGCFVLAFAMALLFVGTLCGYDLGRELGRQAGRKEHGHADECCSCQPR
jgi:hypothetical protein